MKPKTIIFLILILILAGFFRFWRLKTAPPGLHYDENWNMTNALQSLESGEYKVFYPDNFGREGLFIWLITASFKIFGAAPWSLRLVSAIIGTLTVLGLFLLAKELFNEKIALLSSFFLAVSFWHVNFSRIGYRAIMVPFFLCFSFYFLFRGLRKKNALNFILAGVFFGLGFYTYISFRAAILLLAVVIALGLGRHWQKFKKNPWQYYLKEKLWLWDLWIIAFLIILLPLAIHFIRTPSDLFGRSSQVSVFSQPQPLKELSISAVKTLGMFNIYGDPNWRHNFASQPMLNWAVGILFLIGLFLSIREIIRQQGILFQQRRKASRHGSEVRQSADEESEPFSAAKILAGNFCVAEKYSLLPHIFFLSWFIIMLLPAIFTYEGMPHALRSIGIIPIAYIFAALGLNWLIKQIPNKKIAAAVLIIFLLYPAIANYQKYFIEWANNPNVYSSFR